MSENKFGLVYQGAVADNEPGKTLNPAHCIKVGVESHHDGLA